MKITSNMIEAHIFKIVDDGLKFLLIKRAENVIYPGLWQMVNGKIETDEKAFQTALREIKEETNLLPEHLFVVPHINKFYSHENDLINMLPVFAAQVKENVKVKISEEHSDYKWVSPVEAKKLLAWDGQRKSVDLIVQYFTKEKEFLNFVEIYF